MKIEYNIVSFGTEQQASSAGYMAITELAAGGRYILPVAHNVSETNNLNGALTVKKETGIEKIVLARFGLMTQLFLEKTNLNKNQNILVVGAGCVGFACVQMLLLNGYKNVCFTNKTTKLEIAGAKYIQKQNLNYEDFDVIIDATGSASAIKDIFDKCKPCSSIVLLGTCRENGNVDVLNIHRKNLVVYGAHELSGFSDEYRQKVFEKTLNKIKKCKQDFKNIVCLEDKSKLNKLKRKTIYTVYCSNAKN